MSKNLILSATLTIFIALSAHPSYNADVELPKLQAQLAELTNPADSVKVLYDIFDLGNRQQKVAAAEELFAVAGRAGDIDSQLDIVRLSTSYVGPSILNQLQQKVSALPESRLRNETLLFLEMKEIQHDSRYMSYSQQNRKFTELVASLNSDSVSNNPYQRLLSLYKVTAFLRNNHDSEMRIEYMDSLLSLVESKNFQLYALRNLIYAEAALIYTDANDYRRALNADRNLLGVISQLEKYYHDKGREYRNYERSRYNVLRRMLRNYKGLSPKEVDHIYARIQELAAINPEIASHFKKSYATACYDMAKGRYSEAIPQLDRLLRDSMAQPLKVQLLQMMIDAAKQTSDTAILVKAMTEYTDMLTDMNSNAMPQKYRELQVAYDVSTLRAKNTQLQLNDILRQKEALQKNMSLLIALWVICLVTMALLLFYWSKYRRKITTIYNLADNVTAQRDHIKNRKFHEYDADDKFPVKLHNKNVPMKKTLENMLIDALYISALGREEREKHRFQISLKKMLDTIRDAIKTYHPENPKLIIKYPTEDVTLNIDKDCLAYLLTRIIMTAMDRTDSDIELETVIDRHLQSVRFTLVHHGERIPVGSEEILFNDFIHVDFLHQLDNSALFICRLNAFMLQCAITYNPYNEGPAQLIISVPINASI